MMKKILLTALLFLLLFSLYAHDHGKDVPLKEIDASLIEAGITSSMEARDERKLLQFLNLRSDDFDEFLYYQGTESLSVEELLLVKTDDKQALNDAQDAVDRRIQAQIKTFDSYGPTQTALLKNAIIKRKGSYLFYCVGPDAEGFEEVFLHAI